MLLLRYLLKKKKRFSLAIEKLIDRPIDGGQKLKKKRMKTGTVCVVWKKIGSLEVLPHLSWFICLVVKDAKWKMYKGTDNDSVRY